jgi:hypothetical protein
MSTPAPDVPVVGLRPSVDDVAALLRARTQDTEGREVGTFNDDTRPTASEVDLHIDTALALVATRLPVEVPDRFGTAVSSLVAYRAALRIEKSYFPEQVRSDRSAYDQLLQEYTDDLQALLDGLADYGTDGGAGSAGHRAHSEWTPSFLSVYGYGYPLYPGWQPDYWPEPENPANWRASPFQPPREPPLPVDLPVGDRPTKGEPCPGPALP